MYNLKDLNRTRYVLDKTTGNIIKEKDGCWVFTDFTYRYSPEVLMEMLKDYIALYNIDHSSKSSKDKKEKPPYDLWKKKYCLSEYDINEIMEHLLSFLENNYLLDIPIKNSNLSLLWLVGIEINENVMIIVFDCSNSEPYIFNIYSSNNRDYKKIIETLEKDRRRFSNTKINTICCNFSSELRKAISATYKSVTIISDIYQIMLFFDKYESYLENFSSLSDELSRYLDKAVNNLTNSKKHPNRIHDSQNNCIFHNRLENDIRHFFSKIKDYKEIPIATDIHSCISTIPNGNLLSQFSIYNVHFQNPLPYKVYCLISELFSHRNNISLKSLELLIKCKYYNQQKMDSIDFSCNCHSPAPLFAMMNYTHILNLYKHLPTKQYTLRNGPSLKKRPIDGTECIKLLNTLLSLEIEKW